MNWIDKLEQKWAFRNSESDDVRNHLLCGGICTCLLSIATC